MRITWDVHHRRWVLDGVPMDRGEAIVVLQRTARMSRVAADQCLDNHLPIENDDTEDDSVPADGATSAHVEHVEQDALF